MPSGLQTGTFDRVGAGLSMICALHCLVSPLVIGLASAIGVGLLFSEFVEGILIVSALGLASFTYLLGIRMHRQWLLMVVLTAAMLPMLGGLLWYHGTVETVLVVTGSLLLVGGHFWNRSLCLQCEHCRS